MGAQQSIQSSNEERATQSLTQQFSGTCDISCNNTMKDIDISVIKSTVGNISLSQYCTTNGTCAIGSTMDSISDVAFKASNSSSANDADLFSTLSSIGSSKNIKSSNYIGIQQTLSQQANEKCKIGASNTISNVNIYADSSTMGNISIDQSASATGNCTLNNNMRQAAKATGILDNCSQAGGKGKKACGTGKTPGVATVIVVCALAAILILVPLIYKGVNKEEKSKPSQE